MLTYTNASISGRQHFSGTYHGITFPLTPEMSEVGRKALVWCDGLHVTLGLKEQYTYI